MLVCTGWMPCVDFVGQFYNELAWFQSTKAASLHSEYFVVFHTKYWLLVKKNVALLVCFFLKRTGNGNHELITVSQ